MIRDILGLFKRRPDYFGLVVATILSSIGCGLTMVAVYGELAALNASPFYYSASFVLSTFPGLFSSHLAARLTGRINLAFVMIAAELIGALSLVFPIMGIATGNLLFLIIASFFSSLMAGFLLPFHQTFVRRTFEDRDMKTIANLATYTFSTNFIFGTLIGTLIYNYVGTYLYLVFDIVTYVTAAGIIGFVYYRFRSGFAALSEHGITARSISWSEMSPIQKRAFILNPFLAVVCAPCLSVLPASAARFGSEYSLWHLSFTPALLFMLFKTFGQMVGPFVIAKFDFDKLMSNSKLIISCLILFIVFYAGVFFSESLGVAVTLVVLAHIASNVLFILGFYGMDRYFPADVAGSAAAKQYQVMVTLICIAGIWGGWVAEHYGFQSVLLISALSIAIPAGILFARKTADVGEVARADS